MYIPYYNGTTIFNVNRKYQSQLHIIKRIMQKTILTFFYSNVQSLFL